ncbi:hypothetical protein ACI2LC_38415 [Nonomuraea wenchangensis]|uniref:hypothetical protein n=1 Tax=Nonomuraea wenchangensis TaxID=568860 RepID=UPI0033DE1DCB
MKQLYVAGVARRCLTTIRSLWRRLDCGQQARLVLDAGHHRGGRPGGRRHQLANHIAGGEFDDVLAQFVEPVDFQQLC